MVGGGEARDRRERLVEAAFRQVAEVGFEGLRLRQVAEEAGIDHSTLHHHFATKQDLVAAVAAYTTRQFWVTRPPAADTAAARLRAHLDALHRAIVQRPELFVVTVELDLRARRDPAVAVAMAEHESGWRAVLGQILAEHTSDPSTSAELVIAVVKGVRLAPELAGPVFERLAAQLIADERGRPCE